MKIKRLAHVYLGNGMESPSVNLWNYPVPYRMMIIDQTVKAIKI